MESVKTEFTETDNVDKLQTSDKISNVSIQNVIKKGQILLVQAVKDERSTKGASFTTYISLVGKFCIFLPNKDDNSGISRKISTQEQRSRFKSLINLFLENSLSSLIIRTAADQKNLDEIKTDYIYLINQWNRICKLAKSRKAPALLHVEEDILRKVMRDMASKEVEKIFVEGKESYVKMMEITNEMLPEFSKKIILYENKIPIFTKFCLEDKIANLYRPTVDLISGGSIVINPAEGMTLIDVNSGKSNLHDSIEDTALKTNLEASIEIAKQLRLREISGIIMIDFIDMADSANDAIVKKELEKHLSKDYARTQVGNIGSFGVLQMSRQRINSSFLELHSQICPCCSGKGIIRSSNANDILIIRTLESEIASHKYKINVVNVYANSDAILSVLNNKKAEILYLEKKYKVQICFLEESHVQVDQFAIEKISFDSKRGHDKCVS